MSATYSSAKAFSSEAFEGLVKFVEDMPGDDRSLERFERELRERLSAVGTEIMAERLAQYDIDAEEVEIGGELYRRAGRNEKIYRTLSGDVTLERTIYRPRGGGKALAPLELRAELVDGCWTPLLARVMTRSVASTTPKEAAALFGEFGGARPSSSSLDRLPKRISEMWESGREIFETELREEEEVPSAAVTVGVSLDGVHVPMQDGDRQAKRDRPAKPPRGPAGYREVGCGEVVDLFHVLEHIKKAYDAFYGEGNPEAKAAFLQARTWLRECDDGVDRVLRSLRYRRGQSRGETRKTIAAEVRYLEKRRGQLDYARLLEKNLPIGSGVVEAACKTLAAERMKRSGMSWLEPGGQAVLTLRSLIQSDRFDRAWRRITSLYTMPASAVRKVA